MIRPRTALKVLVTLAALVLLLAISGHNYVEDIEIIDENSREQQFIPPAMPQANSQINAARPVPAVEKSLSELETQIDLKQAQLLDFLNGEDINSNQNVFGGSLSGMESPFDIKSTWDHVHQYATLILRKKYKKYKILDLSRRVRACLIAYTILYDKPLLVSSLSHDIEFLRNELKSIVDELSFGSMTRLYPWISPRFDSVKAMQDYFFRPDISPLGIAFAAGKSQFILVLHSILTLRKVLNCTLPIEVHYLGPEDLPENMVATLNSMPGVRTVDLTQYFNRPTAWGWSIKPFAILAAGFRNVIFMDADTLFLKNPEIMVQESVIYQKTGQLFFHDRSLPNGSSTEWFLRVNPVPTNYAMSLRYMKRLTYHEMESGVVVIDKSKTSALHALLLVCRMNSYAERTTTDVYIHGDKETFWMSWDMTRTPYQFVPVFGSSIGYKNDHGKVCGGLLHVGEDLQPLWWNGGILTRKLNESYGFLSLGFIALDLTGENIDWEVETESKPYCLGIKDSKNKIIKLGVKEKYLESIYRLLYEDLTRYG
ncbi:hypothetical protein HK100_004199, partial [Physocladia obscura]